MSNTIAQSLRSKTAIRIVLLILSCTSAILLYERAHFELRLKTSRTEYLDYYGKYMQCDADRTFLSKSQYAETKKDLRKKIRDVTYSIQNNAPGNTYLNFGTISSTGSFQQFTRVDFSPYLSANITDFWFDQTSQTLHLITQQGQNDGGGVELIASVTVKKTGASEIPQYAVVYAKTDGDLYASSKILDYDPVLRQLVLATIGGDGCGGYGTLWRISTTESQLTEIARTEFGCAKAHPRFAGYTGKKLYFLTVKHDSDANHSGEDTYEELFTIDPFTLRRETVAIDIQLFAGMTVTPPTQFVEVRRLAGTLTDTELMFLKNLPDNAGGYFGFDVHTKVLRPL